jgi:CRAL/TRIO, N-terminal domain
MADITPQEEAGLVEMRAQFKDADGLGMPLDDACFLRYSRARNLDVAKAVTMLNATLQWRADFGVQKVLAEELHVVARENATGKVSIRLIQRICLVHTC